jgi:hypothetical protein
MAAKAVFRIDLERRGRMKATIVVCVVCGHGSGVVVVVVVVSPTTPNDSCGDSEDLDSDV